jgi:serine/threonine protein kinase
VQKFEHPQIVRYYALGLEDGYLVREWMHGFSFVDLLRRRRELPAHELRRLLEGIPEAIDAAVAAGVDVVGDLLTRLFVACDRSLTLDDLQRLRGVPISEWRDFAVKLNPLSLHQLLPADDATRAPWSAFVRSPRRTSARLRWRWPT